MREEIVQLQEASFRKWDALPIEKKIEILNKPF